MFRVFQEFCFLRRVEPRQAKKRVCEQCGKEFYPSSTRQKFCNTERDIGKPVVAVQITSNSSAMLTQLGISVIPYRKDSLENWIKQNT